MAIQKVHDFTEYSQKWKLVQQQTCYYVGIYSANIQMWLDVELES